jgi:hypothetical protein
MAHWPDSSDERADRPAGLRSELVAATAHHRLQHVQSKALGLLEGDRGRHGDHAHVVWVIVFDMLLAAQRMHDQGLQRGRQRDQLLVRARAARARQNRHLAPAR